MPEQRVRALLDVNVVGKGFAAEVSRTGIFRASEGLLRAMLRRKDMVVACSAEASWVSELLLLAYRDARHPALREHVVRAWEQRVATEGEGSDLINRILGLEQAGRDARRERANLMLLNATARRRSIGPFDVTHSLRSALPDRARVRTRVRVLTVHDLVPLVHPEWSYVGAEAQMREILGSVDAARDFLIANSAATAGEIADVLGIAADRVFVTPFAADAGTFRPERNPETLAGARARYRIPDGPYFLSLGTLEPRKNLPHLLRCFFRLVDQECLDGVQLVLVGPTGWKTAEIDDLIAGRADLKGRVVRTGFVQDEDLAAIYSAAHAFVFTSLYEGFGLPILEAMRCGIPVISSNAGALPEVAGDAAVMVSPHDEDALCQAMLDMLRDEGRRTSLGERGLERAAGFTWDRTAELTAKAYRAMLDRS